MLGVVLCGGLSSRMGTDKGLINENAKLWAQVAFEKLEALNVPVKLSINSNQQEEYSKFFNEDLQIVDDLSLTVHGPLLGVLSAHLSNLEEDLYILACDLLLMEVSLLEKLLIEKETNNCYEAYVFTNSNEIEPLCGIYTSAGLKTLINLLKNKDLPKYSMKFVLSYLKVCKIPLSDKEQRFFRNFNAQPDVEGLK